MLAGIAAAGCAETAKVRSSPSEADLFINDVYVGQTPATVEIPRSDWTGEVAFRLEKVGYQPLSGELSTGIAPGRVSGAVLSVGTSAIFKRPNTFSQDTYDFRLEPVVEENPETAAARLRRADSLLETGLITKEEHERIRVQVLGDL